MNTTRRAVRAAATLEAPWHTVGRRADVTAAGDDLTLRARIVPWNVAARVTDDGRRFYDETWTSGSLTPDSRVVLYDGHTPGAGDLGAARCGRTPIGRVDNFTDETDGLYADLHVAATARGRDVYELARTLGHVDVSLETDVATPDGDTVVRSSATPLPLTGVAVILPPYTGAFPGAVATARAAAPETTDDDTDDDAEGDDADADTPDAGTGARSTSNIAEVVRREMSRYRGGSRGRGAAPHPLARFGSFDELHAAARSSSGTDAAVMAAAFTAGYRQHRELEAQARTTVGRALLDQVTTDNPGLIPPAWLTNVFGIIDRGRAGITALGGPRSPGDSGMEVDWPYYDGDLAAIVAKQITEKSEIHSVKVSFKRGTAPLETYAGGSDVSYQLQRRSSPAYMALYDRILQIAYGITTETAFDAAILAAAAAPHLALALGDDVDGSATRATLFAGSFRVKMATGAPASAVLAASDVFAALGGKPWLQAPQYGTQNVPGVTSAASLVVDVSGLQIVEAIGMTAGKMVITNPEAAQWLEAGPYLATAEDVAKLGTDVAIWGMGATGAFLPAGIVAVDVDLTVTPPVVARAAAK